MYNIKFEYAQQAQVVYTFKHIQVNLMKTNAASWFNKKSHQLIPKYIRIEANREN
jgi:hypothetical protein